MANGKITQKQLEILEYIKQQILERGYPPAVREICDAVHLKSTSSVHSHLETLEKNGYIRREPVERDARLKKIVVTERGIQLHDSIKQSIEDMERKLAADLTPEQRQQLFAMWEQIKHRLEQEITSDKAKLGKK